MYLPIRPEDLTPEEKATIADIVLAVQSRRDGIIQEGERLDDRVVITLRSLFG